MTAKQDEGAALSKADAKALAKASNERWRERTEELRERRRTMASEVLQYHYDVGQLALSVVEDKEKDPNQRMYGSHTVDDISGAIGMSNSTVHSCMKFARLTTAKELDYFKKNEYPWRAVASLITVEDAKAYTELKKKYEDGAFKNSDELKDEVKQANATRKIAEGKTPNRGGNSSAASMVKSCNTLLSQATSKVLPGFMQAVTDYAKDPDSMTDAAAEAITLGAKEARKNIRATRTLLDKADKLLEDSGL